MDEVTKFQTLSIFLAGFPDPLGGMKVKLI